MSALSVQPSYPVFTDIDGQPLEAGYIWIGTANLDPQTNPISVYWDAALTQPATQPIRTSGGYPVNAGTPAMLYVNSNFSIRVMNKNSNVIYNTPSVTYRVSGDVITDVVTNAGNVTFLQSGTGAVSQSSQEKMREWVSPADFGALGNSNAAGTTGTNDSGAFALLEAAHTDKIVNLEGKYYLVNPPIPNKNNYINGSFVVTSTTTDDQPVVTGLGRGTLKNNTYIPRQFTSSTLIWAAGNFNTAFGDDTMVSNTTGRRNTAVGANCFRLNTTGFYNTVVGAWAAYNNTTGNYNTVIGNQSFQYNTSGSNNTVVGEGSLNANTSGNNNTVVGDTAAVSLQGSRNIAIGSQALKLTSATVNDTIAIGYQALSFNLTGVENVAIGNAVLGSATSGAGNVGLGYRALRDLSTGNNNTAVGRNSAILSTTGSSNTAVGADSLGGNTTGSSNTAIGNGAMGSSGGSSSSNTAIGHLSLGSVTGNNNTAIGRSAGTNITSETNTTAVGYDAQPTASNQVKLGNTAVTQINLGNNLIIDVAQILANPSGNLVVELDGGVTYIRAAL